MGSKDTGYHHIGREVLAENDKAAKLAEITKLNPELTPEEVEQVYVNDGFTDAELAEKQSSQGEFNTTPGSVKKKVQEDYGLDRDEADELTFENKQENYDKSFDRMKKSNVTVAKDGGVKRHVGNELVPADVRKQFLEFSKQYPDMRGADILRMIESGDFPDDDLMEQEVRSP